MNYKITVDEAYALDYWARIPYDPDAIHLGSGLTSYQVLVLIDRKILKLEKVDNDIEITFKGMWCLYLYSKLKYDASLYVDTLY